MFEIACLATMIYFEARNQPIEGQVAVAYSAINRAAAPEYKDTLCEVVFDGCQYSFYCDGKSDRPTDMDAYMTSLYVAGASMVGYLKDPTEGATHYHAYYITPWWADKLEYSVTIQDHIFYRNISSDAS